MTNTRLDTLLNYLNESPEDSFILFAIAKEYEKKEELTTALDYYQKLEHLHEEYVGTYYHLGKLWELLEEPQKAFETYKKGMQIAKKIGDKHSLSELAGAKLNLGDDEDFE